MTHWGEPVDARNVSSGQVGTHVVAPTTDTNPAAHAGHAEVPVTAEEVPAGQGEQGDDPRELNEPGAHVCVQIPDGQGKHLDDPGADVKPAPHGAQSPPDVL